jgi:hypothetical protein
MIEIPEFATKRELFDWLVTNKKRLEAQKKAVLKKADCISFKLPNDLKVINKADGNGSVVVAGEIIASIVINTTNLMDSHSDVHIPGIWDKSLSENRMIFHVQEHELEFKNIISDSSDLKAYVKTYNWSELGANFPGQTQALVFDSTIKSSRNPFMFEQYSKGYVRNHSVGMRYVQLTLCLNDENNGAEYEAWQKYFHLVANKETAEEKGYFWAVKEAKVVEGSAVVLGSNWVTPTMSVKTDQEPGNSTPKSRETTPKKIDINKLIQHLNN